MNESMKAIEVAIANVGTDWIPAEFKTDKQKQLLLESFINVYRDVSVQWKSEFCELLSITDTLNGLEFPQALKGLVKQLDCLKMSKYEKIEVKNCRKGLGEFFCEVLFFQPQELIEIMPLIPITYADDFIGYGISTGLGDRYSYVKETASGQIK